MSRAGRVGSEQIFFLGCHADLPRGPLRIARCVRHDCEQLRAPAHLDLDVLGETLASSADVGNYDVKIRFDAMSQTDTQLDGGRDQAIG